MQAQRSGQMSASDRKKKDNALQKKARAKRKAFRAKKNYLLDTTSSIANFQGKQLQVKQSSQTSGEINAENQAAISKEQGIQAINDNNAARLELIERQKEGAEASLTQMGNFRKKADDHRAVVTTELINDARDFNKIINGLFEGLSEAQKKALADALKALTEGAAAKIDLMQQIAKARAEGKEQDAQALEQKMKDADLQMKQAIEDTAKDLHDRLNKIQEEIDKQNKRIEDLNRKIQELAALVGQGAKELSAKVDELLNEVNNVNPSFANEPQYKIYWCNNQLNRCRQGGFSLPDALLGDTVQGTCLGRPVLNLRTGVTEWAPVPLFCHEGWWHAEDFCEGRAPGNGANMSKLHDVPLTILKYLMDPALFKFRLGYFEQAEMTTLSPYYQNRLRPPGKNPAYKVLFPDENDTNQSPDHFNRQLIQAIGDAVKHFILNPVKSP